MLPSLDVKCATYLQIFTSFEGYLSVFCQTLLDELDRIPGDARTQIGFITFDSSLHFYNLSDSYAQAQMMVVSDVDGEYLPTFLYVLIYVVNCDIYINLLMTISYEMLVKHLHRPRMYLVVQRFASLKMFSNIEIFHF